MTKHSIWLGGSTAERALNCHGAHQLINKLPPIEDVASSYAQEGTDRHEVMDAIFNAIKTELTHVNMQERAVDFLGHDFSFGPFSELMYDDGIEEGLSLLGDLLEQYGGGFKVAAVELRVQFPGIMGAFGTADLLLVSATHVIMLDWKFGAGVAVKAVYSDEHGDIVNPQLMFYLASAMSDHPRFFKKRQIVVAIAQPRVSDLEGRMTHTVVKPAEVKAFVEDMQNAALAAIGRDPELRRGAWCRWCPAKVACPKWVGPITELARFAPGPTQTKLVINKPDEPTEYAEFLSTALDVAEAFKDYVKVLDEAAQAFIDGGGVIPGWQIAWKKKLRKWIDHEDRVAEELYQLGFNYDEIWAKKLQTFGVTDKVAKKLGVKIPEGLRYLPEPTDTELVRADGAPNPLLNRNTALKQLEASVAKLTTAKAG